MRMNWRYEKIFIRVLEKPYDSQYYTERCAIINLDFEAAGECARSCARRMMPSFVIGV